MSKSTDLIKLTLRGILEDLNVVNRQIRKYEDDIIMPFLFAKNGAPYGSKEYNDLSRKIDDLYDSTSMTSLYKKRDMLSHLHVTLPYSYIGKIDEVDYYMHLENYSNMSHFFSTNRMSVRNFYSDYFCSMKFDRHVTHCIETYLDIIPRLFNCIKFHNLPYINKGTIGDRLKYCTVDNSSLILIQTENDNNWYVYSATVELGLDLKLKTLDLEEALMCIHKLLPEYKQ